jgi:hypothetical protein
MSGRMVTGSGDLVGLHGVANGNHGVYRITACGPNPAKLGISSSERETPRKRSMELPVVNPVTQGDRSSRRKNAYESGRMDKSRS